MIALFLCFLFFGSVNAMHWGTNDIFGQNITQQKSADAAQKGREEIEIAQIVKELIAYASAPSVDSTSQVRLKQQIQPDQNSLRDHQAQPLSHPHS